MNKIFVAFILVFALNCKATQSHEKMGQEDVVLVAKGNLYGSGKEGIKLQNGIITEESEWKDLIAKMNSINNVSSSFSESKIDFSKYTIIAVFDAVKSTGGHSLELDIKHNSENIEVNIISTSPEGMATTVMTQPYCIVKITKSDLPIIFSTSKN